MKHTNKLSDLGEFGFISRIAASAQTGTGVVTGIGDDAAVTRLKGDASLFIQHGESMRAHFLSFYVKQAA